MQEPERQDSEESPSKVPQVKKEDTVGFATNKAETVDSLQETNANPQQTDITNNAKDLASNIEAQKDHMDDGGEVLVVGEEDTVIY